MACFFLAGCSSSSADVAENNPAEIEYIPEAESTLSVDEAEEAAEENSETESTAEERTTEESISEELSFDLSSVPEYSDSPYVAINGNVPYFTDDELTTTSYESYSDLDSMGRCGAAIACVGQDLMPTEERGPIGSIKPTGWHTVKYDGIDGNYLYNRCHLIAYQLSGENTNEKNLITGTRYLNVEGMLPFENLVADYVEETGNHVLYRVTPIFEGDNLVANGVLIEAMSVEDNGEGILFNIYCYNVQPGIGIDYATGDSWSEPTEKTDTETTYILNTNTKKFHYPSCSSVDQMKESNKQEYTGSRDDLINQGYDPCGRCNPYRQSIDRSCGFRLL
ncbi:MAG: DNA/RNA non-specific endonuclease [Clostridiales bacterium]|nr:DNA/RNA non-specific endonuclease [Clostridiales bacterium]